MVRVLNSINMLALISNKQLILALIMGAFIGGVAGYLGTLMVTKRMALMSGALGHLTLPGIALALIYGFDVSLGALAFLAIGVVLIWLLQQRTKIPPDALTGIVFSSSVAVAFLFLPKEEVEIALIGDISQITLPAVIIVSVLSLMTFIIARATYKKLIFISISEDLAKSEDVDIRKYNFIYLVCIALVVALGIRVVGGLLTAALVAIPAGVSRNLSKNLAHYSYGGLIAGGLSAVLGILVFSFTGIPAGPLIIISGAVLFLISLVFKRQD